MHPHFQQLMAKATELTRAGRLQEATAVIQTALASATPAAPMSAPRSPAASTPSLVLPKPADSGAIVPVVEVMVSDSPRADGLSGESEGPAINPAARRPARQYPAVEPTEVLPEDGQRERPRVSGGVIRGRFKRPKVGTRAYRLYLPPDTPSRPRPLVVMLHGCDQTAEDFARGTRMDEVARREGFAVLYPEQSVKANPQRCWNWFRGRDQAPDRGEPALLADLVRQTIADHDLDASRVFVAGLSAGGAMAALLGRTHPELFSAIGVHSGLAAGAANDLPSALAAMRGLDGPAGAPAPGRSPTRPTIVFHGSADMIVHPSNGERVIADATPPEGRRDDDATRPMSSRPEGLPGLDPADWQRPATRAVVRDRDGTVVAEHWVIHGAPHAWAGGSPTGSFTDPLGPDATTEMVRFFLARPPRQRD